MSAIVDAMQNVTIRLPGMTGLVCETHLKPGECQAIIAALSAAGYVIVPTKPTVDDLPPSSVSTKFAAPSQPLLLRPETNR